MSDPIQQSTGPDDATWLGIDEDGGVIGRAPGACADPSPADMREAAFVLTFLFETDDIAKAARLSAVAEWLERKASANV